jgi:hypothetical protein
MGSAGVRGVSTPPAVSAAPAVPAAPTVKISAGLDDEFRTRAAAWAAWHAEGLDRSVIDLLTHLDHAEAWVDGLLAQPSGVTGGYRADGGGSSRRPTNLPGEPAGAARRNFAQRWRDHHRRLAAVGDAW